MPGSFRAQMRRARAAFGRLTFAAARALERTPAPTRVVAGAYRAAHRLTPRRPEVLFRLGRVNERTRDWHGAEAAYSAAIALEPADIAAYYARRAVVRDRQGRLHDALADSRRVPSERVPKRLLPRLAVELRREGQVPDAIELLKRAAGDGSPNVLSALAECYADLGELSAACRVLRTAVGAQPDNLTIRTSLGRLAGRRSLVPFELVGETVVPTSPHDQHAALVEAVTELQHVIDASQTRTWTAYWLGRLQESHGMLADACQSYEAAVKRVQGVDKPWSYHALQAWRFRREYVQAMLSGKRAADSRLNRRVVIGSNSPERPDAAVYGGFYEASLTNNGLFIEGFTLRGRSRTVDILVDGQPIVSVAGDHQAWHHDFKVTIVHDVLSEFPVWSVLTVRAGEHTLVTVRGAQSVDLSVPDGTGQLGRMLDEGRKITKKGRWSDAVQVRGSRDEVYLAAYKKAQEVFEERLGIKLFVSYGTLLGCYRDGRLIPGDDDFDVSFVAAATDPESLKKEGREVIEALLRAGFDSRVAVDGRMFHLRVDDVVLDVNPFWFYDGRAWSFDAHRLDRDAFVPVATMTVNGMEIYIPRRAEDFLADNYGPDWKTPRPDFQYHRAKAVQRTLRLARLVPSEVRSLLEYSEELRAHDPAAGRFHGYADPTKPQFEDS